MKFVIGLGNPGLEYKATKHNAGFSVVQRIAKECGIKIKQKMHHSIVGLGKIGGKEVMLILPQTYMNMSGKVAEELLRERKCSPEDLLVICDDINLKLGRIRLRHRGSSGGHKGLESIVKMLGRDDFARLRVGIATEVHRGDITNYVLAPFKRRELKNVAHVLDLAEDAAICWVNEGIENAMNKFNKTKVAMS